MPTIASLKSLPPLPFDDSSTNQGHPQLGDNALGLGFGPIGDEQINVGRDGDGGHSTLSGVVGSSTIGETNLLLTPGSSPSRKPSPSYVVPLRDPLTPIEPTTNRRPIHDSNHHSARSSPVSSPLKPSHPARPPYQGRSSSNSSTVSISDRSAHTMRPGQYTPSLRSMDTTTHKSISKTTDATEWGGRGERPKLHTSTSSPNFNRKRSSSQLLSGLGKGLNRMGSVMRRNTSDPTYAPSSTSSPHPLSSSLSRSWKRKGKAKEQTLTEEGEEWEKVDHLAERDPRARREPIPGDGDEGIGRPFNVEHDLHVSPSLEDLPSAWLDQLRTQGVSEKDLLLIASARRKQASVSLSPLRYTKLSAPPNSTSTTSGISSLAPPFAETIRLRGASSPPTTSDVLSTGRSVSTSAGSASTVSRKVSFKARLKKFAFETPPNTDPVPSEHTETIIIERTASPTQVVDEEQDTAMGLIDFGGGRKMTPKSDRRLSDQIRCFSQFDLGNDEAWGSSLLQMMSADDTPVASSVVSAMSLQEVPTAVPSRTSAASLSATPSTGGGEAVSPANRLLVTPTPAHTSSPVETPGPQTPSERDSPENGKAIKRIPIPPLLAPSTPKRRFNLTEIRVASTPDPPWPSPPPPPPPAKKRNSSAEPATFGEPSIPLRKSSESFGVHYHIHSQSSVELDPITPSSANILARRTPSRHSSDEGSIEEVDIDEADRTFVDVQSRVSLGAQNKSPHELVDPSASTQSFPPPSIKNPTSRHKHHSLPASAVSSEISRPPTPDRGSFLQAKHDDHDPLSGADGATPDKRASVAFSIMSSESLLHNSLHGATVQMAYTKVLTKLREVNEDGEGKVEIRRTGEVDDDGDMVSEGESALDALDEAARKIAGEGRRGSA